MKNFLITMQLGKTFLAIFAVLFSFGCGPRDLEADRFVDALLEATANSKPDASFKIVADRPYSVVLFNGPVVDTTLLRTGGLEGPRLEGVVQAAPKDFKAAVAIVTTQGVSIGWFLGNYVNVQRPVAVAKPAGASIQITLKYGGSLPEVVSMR